MTPTVLQPATIANVVYGQPNCTLDCSSLAVSIYDHQNKDFLVLQTLTMSPVQGNPSRWELVCHLRDQTDFVSLSLQKHDQHDYSFHINDNNPSTNPILKAIPGVPLFSANNSLGLTKDVPVDPPYCCTLTETHQLLQLHIPDLPIATIQQFCVPLTVVHALNWPASDQETTYLKAYTLPTKTGTHAINSGVHKLNVHRTDASDLYVLRNRVMLSAIFTLVYPLCCWCTLTLGNPPELANLENITQLYDPAYDNRVQVHAFPNIPWGSAPDPNHLQSSIALTDLLPVIRYRLPSTSASTPFEIAHHIQCAIELAQAANLQC